MTVNTIIVEKCQYSDARETSWNVYVNGTIAGRVSRFKETASTTTPYIARKANDTGKPWEVVATEWVSAHGTATKAKKAAVAALVAAVAG